MSNSRARGHRRTVRPAAAIALLCLAAATAAAQGQRPEPASPPPPQSPPAAQQPAAQQPAAQQPVPQPPVPATTAAHNSAISAAATSVDFDGVTYALDVRVWINALPGPGVTPNVLHVAAALAATAHAADGHALPAAAPAISALWIVSSNGRIAQAASLAPSPQGQRPGVSAQVPLSDEKVSTVFVVVEIRDGAGNTSAPLRSGDLVPLRAQ